MDFTCLTPQDEQQMLQELGLTDLSQLFAVIPAALRRQQPLDLPSALAEPELVRLMEDLNARNLAVDRVPCFLGAGAYRHYVPRAVAHLLQRSEFYTAYTPYQPEISQGTLQAIFEYQTMVCELTGMEVANASMYDGASALAEAVLMAWKITGRPRVIVAGSVHPAYLRVLRTYLQALHLEILVVETSTGVLVPETLGGELSDRVAAVIVQQPNFLGLLEQIADLANLTRAQGALLISVNNPIALGLLQPPGTTGVDIAVGEGQGLGGNLVFGGPYLGFLATKERYLRRLPGRVVGMTADRLGRRGFVLTVQAREQHIRREKATSNICTNEALCALAFTMHLALLGPSGLRRMAELCMQKAHYAWQRLTGIAGVQPVYRQPFFNEFVLRFGRPAREINAKLLAEGIIGGLDLERFFPGREHDLLLCVTEMTGRAEIDRLAEALEAIK